MLHYLKGENYGVDNLNLIFDACLGKFKHPNLGFNIVSTYTLDYLDCSHCLNQGKAWLLN